MKELITLPNKRTIGHIQKVEVRRNAYNLLYSFPASDDRADRKYVRKRRRTKLTYDFQYNYAAILTKKDFCMHIPYH